MSASPVTARATRRQIEQPGAVRGFLRMLSLVISTFAALIGGIWWSSSSTCATTVCRLDVPVTALPEIKRPAPQVAERKPAVSSSKPVRREPLDR